MRPRPSGQASGQENLEQDTRPEFQQSDRRQDLSPRPADHTQGARRGFASAEDHGSRDSETTDRRKTERILKEQQLLSRGTGTGTGTGTSASILEEEGKPARDVNEKMEVLASRRPRARGVWRASTLTVCTTLLSLLVGYMIVNSFLRRQLDTKGCDNCSMYPAYAKLSDFDSEHTRLANKYSLWLYREHIIDTDTRVKGVPVLFITGNAGSYRQVRPLAAYSAQYFAENVQNDIQALAGGSRDLDWFSADFNEDFTAFHGQTLLDQAEYLNDAIAYILSLYHNPASTRRDPNLPDPTSVIVVGHSMGGIVARTMLNMTNYRANSINTIITMSSPHARAPLPFDSDMVNTYERINEYWRESYAQPWASDNPLWHVTLISIAGGGLDTIVPSDYASVSSLVPSTHGFTVFTSSVPNVWTGTDHLSILWCNQFRQVVARSILDVVDVNRPSQTKPRLERMRVFKKWFLTGMEGIAEKTLPQQEPSTSLTLEDSSSAFLPPGEQLVLRGLGGTGTTKAYLMPIPRANEQGLRRFTLLTDQTLDKPGGEGNLEVLLCTVSSAQSGQAATMLAMNIDLAGSSSDATRLSCKTAALDVIPLPASRPSSKFPFDKVAPFSYLQYGLETLSDHNYVAVIDKARSHSAGFVIAEFADRTKAHVQSDMGLYHLITHGYHAKLPADRAVVTDINIPAAYSGLVAYRFRLSHQACSGDGSNAMFAPLLRQHISEPYESKYYVNVREAEISLHGIAPFMPPPMRGHSKMNGLNLQLWTDTSCQSSVDVKIEVDLLGSLGKLGIRYRTVLPAIPLLIVAVVLRKQFTTHDKTGVFITFMESLDLCLRSNLPLLVTAMTLLAVSFASGFTLGADATSAHIPSQANAMDSPLAPSTESDSWARYDTEGFLSYTRNDLLLGQADPFFWFLVPLFAFISIGLAVLLNYVALALTALLHSVFSFMSALFGKRRPQVPYSPTYSAADLRRKPPGFAVVSPRRRILVTTILVLSVATVIPYPFAYMVACIVQLATCVRALRLNQDTHSAVPAANFYNYAHSIFLLMLWVAPINIPVLVVWVHNLGVTLSPFASHHNTFSILPFVLLVEVGASGRMIPRVKSSVRLITSIMFFGFAVYSAIYGVSYSYQLHHIANIICAWLVALHFSEYDVSWETLVQLVTDGNGGNYDLLGGSDSRLLKKHP